ncbi:MAG: deoxyguanosinetriphosphate triphosphohydrolase [Candidatus Omnitrophica bacterium]|nr:deoxyguanosinetriphosphate triphosphohydrolase [Candidatus Omnitrophota bacterium]
MRTRQDIEEWEDRILALYAARSRESLGREFDEPLQEIRTCYQRDRDRVVHSEAFRKLEYKTQVFVIFEGDYYRTRLTHSIEVAQIARTIGRSLGLNEDLIEAIALAHDLGHPPFGHAGETMLNDLMKMHGGFNHNFRSYEIVTRLEKRYPDFDGLNLSREVLVGILKHETNYDIQGRVPAYKDIGPTLEAKVVDVADALAYLSHDVDDGLTSGCIDEADLAASGLWQQARRRVDGVTNDVMRKYQLVKFLIDAQVRDLLDFSSSHLRERNFRSAAEAQRWHLARPRDAAIGFSPAMKSDVQFLQEILLEKLYHHYRVERMTSKAKRIIQDLFDVYLENPKQLPYHVYERAKNYSRTEVYQVICGYIAGMTDRFALDEHKKLFNPYQKV